MLDTVDGRFRLSVAIFVGAIAFMVVALWAEAAYSDYIRAHPIRPTVVIPTPLPAN